MDYQEEQSQELAALEAIYPAEFTITKADYPASFSVIMKSDRYDEESGEGACVTVEFAFAEKYPEQLPTVAFDDVEGLEDEEIEQLTNFLMDEAKASLGMQMMFTLISGLQERLNSTVEESKQRRIETEERRKQEEEEREQKRFEGTRVTVEAFWAWKKKFDAELAVLNKKAAVDTTKLTGRQQFLSDATLGISDLKLLEEDDMKIDEALFADDLDELDLEDAESEEEDGDYVPSGQSDAESD